MKKMHAFGLVGLALIIVGSIYGLTASPPERHMGDVSRILYVHVPTAWNCLLIYLFAFGFAIASLWTGKQRWDIATTAAIETGVVLNILLLGTGMIFAKPTWGIWWDWDVRLTTSLIALIFYAAILALRTFIDDPNRRATLTAVTCIISFVDVPLIYFGVRWWRSLHQIQSSPETMAETMVFPMRVNAFAVLFISIWFMLLRARIERSKLESDEVVEPPVRRAMATA